MTEEKPEESRSIDEENPYQATVRFEEANDPSSVSPFKEFFPVQHFLVFMVSSISFLLVPPIGIISLATGVLAMLRCWFWVSRIRQARFKGFDYPVPSSQSDLFMGSLAIGFGVAIVWPIAFVATCVPMAYGVEFVASFGKTSSDFWVFGMSVSFLFAVISSTFLCTWIVRMTLPRSPKVNS